jgi:hypothetical protein
MTMVSVTPSSAPTHGKYRLDRWAIFADVEPDDCTRTSPDPGCPGGGRGACVALVAEFDPRGGSPASMVKLTF